MPNTPTSRVTLEKEAQESLAKMLSELKREGRFIKISPSKLASWIILCFAQKDFSKQKDKIIKAHFSSKAYLKDITNGLEDSPDLEAILRRALKKTKPQREKHGKKTS